MNNAADIYIAGSGLITPAGIGVELACEALDRQYSFIREDKRVRDRLTAAIPSPVLKTLFTLQNEKKLKDADLALLAAVAVVRQALGKMVLDASNMSVIVASSRGSQNSVEDSLKDYHLEDIISFRNSPRTTFGRLSSTIAQDIGSSAGAISVSSTCSSGLQAMGLAMAQLRSGICEQVLVVATEFAITNFFVRSLEKLSVYCSQKKSQYSYAPFACDRNGNPTQNGMVLGEGAACLILSTIKSQQNSSKLVGFGANTDRTTSTGVSKNAFALQKSMSAATAMAGLSARDVGLVMAHGSGNPIADKAESVAYDAFFEQTPSYTSCKYSLGHALGASSLISAVVAEHCLAKNRYSPLPYTNILDRKLGKQHLASIENVMVNAIGFGGATASVILQK